MTIGLGITSLCDITSQSNKLFGVATAARLLRQTGSHKEPKTHRVSPPSLPHPGAQLLQDHQAANGLEEGEEEAAGAELSALQVGAGVCVRHAARLRQLRQVQRGESHES